MSATDLVRYDFGRFVVERAMKLHSANIGSTASQLRQGVRDRPAQPSNRFIGKERPCAYEPVHVCIEGGQGLSQSCDLGLKDWIFSCPYFPEVVAKRADFLRQGSEIRQHVPRRQIDS